MLSGLIRFIKIVLPKGLFYRSLIIVAAPIIILQLIVSVVFFVIIERPCMDKNWPTNLKNYVISFKNKKNIT